ncbi:MAG: helix-turn-helix domain-containing protein [Leptospiraceae bacterium]|nr:helix-turn-helix domain-containing protein [Leptospiraceae bacterium]MDW7976888.1 helix-turn-helix domain-containing protein [Leptospiraceae bacterium]
MKYKHLSLNERKEIERLYGEGYTITKIAKILNRNPSTISRELKRNSQQMENRTIYIAESANQIYLTKRKKKRERSENQKENVNTSY